MKKLLLLSLSIVISAACFCSDNNDLKHYELRGKVKLATTYIYNAKKIASEWIAEETVYYANKLSLDENGFSQGIEFYDYGMNLSGRLMPVREKGEMVGEVFYNENGELEHTTQIKRNSSTEIERISFNADNEKIYYQKELLEDGKVIKSIAHDIVVGTTDTLSFEYDKNGNEILEREIRHSGKESIRTHEYLEFDDNNNWTKALLFYNSIGSMYIVTREIEYY